MPKKPEPALHPEARYNLVLPIPGWLKNRLMEAADHYGLPLSTYCKTVLMRAAAGELGFPVPPPARGPFPSTADQIRAWAVGEQLLLPCGRVGSCEGEGVGRLVLGGVEFCGVCEVRVV